MAQLLDFESNGGRISTGLEGTPRGVPLLSFCLIGEAVPDSGNGTDAGRIPAALSSAMALGAEFTIPPAFLQHNRRTCACSAVPTSKPRGRLVSSTNGGTEFPS